MKRIDSCGSLIDPSTLNINSSLTISRKKFKLTPLAIACSILLTSFAAQSQNVPSNDLNNLTGSVKINSQTILENLKESKHKDKPDLVGFFNDDYYWSEDENKYVSAENSRINFEGFNELVKPNDTFLIKWTDQTPSTKEEKYNATITIKAENNNWTLQYDFAEDGINQDTDKPYSTHTTALSFFENAMMTADSNNKTNNLDLKYFDFQPTVNLITKNHLVGAANKGDGRSSLGISLSNKKRNLTFEKEVNFISDFSFYEEEENPDYSNGSSGVENLSVAAGIYNVFGAAEYNAIEKIQNSINNYGVINFKQHATVSVTHIKRSDFSEQLPEDPRYNEVFGVFNNEGGTTVFENGADIVVKGYNDDGIVSALASASTLGILDPNKQGKIEVTASDDNKVSRIWGVSIDGENTDITTPFDSSEGNRLQNQDILSHEDVTQAWNTYISNKANMQNGNLRFAALSMHGSEISISDEDKSGYFDIRGDIMAGMLNGDGTKSNTFHNLDTVPANDFWQKSDLSGTVQHAEVNLTLENSQSKLYGNLYERHRFGDSESVKLTEETSEVTNQSDSNWKKEQINKEKESLGGKINFTLANGATWMPQQKWYGWNYDFVHTDFYLAYNNKTQTTLTNTESVSYNRLDLSDQYNLNMWNGKEYITVNQPPKDNHNLNNSAINDNDLLKDENDNYFPDINKTDFETVDNGIYGITLNGGVVDTRYMRQAFSFADVDSINEGNLNYDSIDNGIKKLRIQELAGTGGTFNIYVKDKDNHDLVIIDKLADTSTAQNTTIDFKIWNSADKEFEESLYINENDASTYVQIARINKKNINYKDTIDLGPRDGDIQSVTYTIKSDENNTWTKTQHGAYHDQMQNLFITKADIKTAPEIIEGARLSSSLAYNYAIMDIDRLQKRRGEARHIKDSEDGIWARYRHINSGLTGNDDSADMIQIGYDYKVRNDESYNVYSIAVDYLRGQSDFDESGDSDLDRYSIALYDTWLLDNGAYLDLTAKVGWFDADMDARFRHINGYYEVNGDYDFWGASVGAEIGRKFSNKDQWFFEPQTQLTYTYIGSYDFNTDRGVKVESDNVDSLIMRWGLRVGKDFGNSAEEGLYSIYLMGDILHDFLGDQELTVAGLRTGNTAVADFDGERTWYDVGVGFSCTLSENSYMFINYERSLGHDIDNTWEVSAGASMAF
ncbi:autotransporter outer membrane beta-barrel domain-containing protein [Succinatimonas hippei]|uniref:autotransporter outer membrane beta-barrel domain-containing protein n=1 Tax=Succinatimonas hippei TaxID=626938 RepID=UPI0026EEBAB5|nr:autotransporter outer membrane beta-barrel domain-containing protein [Succinatimonas hippei]